jgi:hypothetical protein
MKHKPFHAMKNPFLLICFFAFAAAVGQDNRQATIEKRATELHRVMGLNEKEQWKKFVKENYSKSLLERPVKSTIKTSEEGSTTSTSAATADMLEEKLKMFERLHRDFGSSKVVSLKTVNDKIEMILENTSGLKGNFNIDFEKHAPFLIDGIKVEINQNRH